MLKNRKIHKKFYINSASFNSKKIKKNSIFVGVKGKKYDGNNFAKEAIKNGALLAITNKRIRNSKTIYNKKPLDFLIK